MRQGRLARGVLVVLALAIIAGLVAIGWRAVARRRPQIAVGMSPEEVHAETRRLGWGGPTVIVQLCRGEPGGTDGGHWSLEYYGDSDSDRGAIIFFDDQEDWSHLAPPPPSSGLSWQEEFERLRKAEEDGLSVSWPDMSWSTTAWEARRVAGFCFVSARPPGLMAEQWVEAEYRARVGAPW